MEKKKHHYVWRDYLRSWSSGEYVFTYSKNQNKIFTSNLMGVAMEKYFYALDEFTLEEEINLKEVVKSCSNETVVELNLELYESFIIYSKILRFKKENAFVIDSETKQEKLDKITKLIKSNLFEEFHTIIENYGSRIIKIKKFEEIRMFDDEDNLFFLMIFLCSQFLRTKKMKKKLELMCEKNELIIPKFINIISLVFANSLAVSLADNKDVRYVFYENKTDLNFITSDQPLMNLKFNDKDESGKVIEFEFYYPINTRIAILI
ncbi:DUF4238 domain-containing protein, partial [Flavobacterium panici]|uniref:DUF4238 domain-containing protein n=2 Tax=Flavobacteriaceae TaxID=49546 RepID=UPI0015DE4353